MINYWEEQKRVLKELGYNSYKEYLAGIVWADIREKVFTTNGNRCYICNRNATCIHHRCYTEDVLRGKDITSMVPLCWDCHNVIEYDEYGKKLELYHANNKLEWYKRNPDVWKKSKYSGISIGVSLERKRFKSALL